MPKESLKNQKKNSQNKQDATDQRKTKQGRNQNQTSEKKESKNSADSLPTQYTEKEIIKTLSDPDVLNISEGHNSKYNKKEITSNWHKYEIPIESYEEIENDYEGADFEKLISMPLSGGHFQFKHEKTWESEAAIQSEYDKYFNINLDNLSVALCTIPFYERNDIDKSEFTDIDITTMDSKASIYKQKYFNDKSFTSMEFESLDKNISKECLLSEKIKKYDDIDLSKILLEAIPQTSEENMKDENPLDKNLFKSVESQINLNEINNIIIGDDSRQKLATQHISPKITINKDADESNKPVDESPDDLEKWLDDFLDN